LDRLRWEYPMQSVNEEFDAKIAARRAAKNG